MSNLSDPVHFTNLKRIELSPAHYKAAVEQGYHKSVFGDGRLLHLLCLGGEPYAVYDGKRMGNAWKDFLAEQVANGVKEENVFTIAEQGRVMPMADAVKNNPIVRRYGLLDGEREKEILWKYLGRDCSSRLDVVNRERRRIVDLKKAASAEPDRFAYASRRYSYQAQGAFYRRAAAYVGIEVDEVILLTVEPEPPYAVTPCRLSPRLLEQGDKINRIWFEKLLACEASGEWPEYVQDIVDIDVPQEDGFRLTGFGGDDEPAEEAAQ